jgi:polysaccharide chain length determinant protein (PEP-CTERM system associated)
MGVLAPDGSRLDETDMLPGQTLGVPVLLRMVRRRWWLLVMPPAIGLFVALVVSAWLPNVYQSDVLVGIVPQRVPDTFVRSTVTLKTEERLTELETHVTSRSFIEQMINEYGLYPVERGRLPLEDVVGIMRNAIQVQPEALRRGPRGFEPLHAFHVRYTYADAQIAARVTQRLGQLFVDQNARDRGALAEATSKFLDNALEQAVGQLEQTERRLKEFRERHGNELPTQLQSNMTAIQGRQMQVQAMVETIARDKDRKQMLERLYNEEVAETRVVASPVQQQPTQSADPTTVTGSPEQRLAAARAALSAMEVKWKPDHPEIRRIKATIQELEKQVVAVPKVPQGTPVVSAPLTLTPEEMRRVEQLREQRAEVESLDRQIAFKEQAETRLRDEMAEYQRRIEAVPGVESEWTALTRDYDTRKTAYEDLLKKSEDARVAVDLERKQIGEQFRIVDAAVVPNRPISPARIQINAIGLVIGLFLGLGIAALLELRDGSLRTENDVLSVLSLPVLAIVPYVVTSQERGRRKRKLAFVGAGGAVATFAAAYVFWTLQLWKFVV